MQQLISICINTHNEGPRVRATLDSFRANLGDTPHEFIVIADGVTDGCCNDLGDNVTVIRNVEREGCGKCKLQAIEAASGDVLIFCDAHMCVLEGLLVVLADMARAKVGIVTPVIRNIDYAADWTTQVVTGYDMIPNHTAIGFDKKQYAVAPCGYRQDHNGKAIPMVGVGFAASRETLKAIGGVNNFYGLHGSQERGIALRAFMANVPVILAGFVVLGHEFRRGKPRPEGYLRLSKREQQENMWHAFYAVTDDGAFATIRRRLLKIAPDGVGGIDRPEAKQDRQAFTARRDSRELLTLLGLTTTQARPEKQEAATPLTDPKIDVRIAYEPGGKIGADYNRIMRESPHEWVLFLDHDVLLLHPSWYEVCQRAIRENPGVGLFTCLTNNIACKHQKAPGAPAGHDISRHREYARELWDKHGATCTKNTRHLIGGFLMLTSKAAWEKAGGFPEDSFFGVDNEYHRRLMAGGGMCCRIDGLYCYHIRNREGGNWLDGVDTSATLSRNRTPLEFARSGRPDIAAAMAAKHCVYTVLTGGYDRLQPVLKQRGWDYIMLTTEDNVEAPPGWIVRKFDAEGHDAKRASRLPKCCPHKYLADYDYSLYIDANMRMKGLPGQLVERAGRPAWGTVKHPWRQCAYEELDTIVSRHKATAEKAAAEVARYRAEGVPEQLGLYENGCTMRRHNDSAVKTIGEAWLTAYLESETQRDQPCLPVVLWRMGEVIHIISATERGRFVRIIPHDRKCIPA